MTPSPPHTHTLQYSALRLLSPSPPKTVLLARSGSDPVAGRADRGAHSPDATPVPSWLLCTGGRAAAHLDAAVPTTLRQHPTHPALLHTHHVLLDILCNACAVLASPAAPRRLVRTPSLPPTHQPTVSPPFPPFLSSTHSLLPKH